MRPNNQGGNNFNRRPRNQNRGGPNNNSGGSNIRRPQQPQNLRNQVFDSHGPNGERVRGNAFQVHEKYQSLARDAEERVDQEAYGQHAEHYYRIVEAIQEMEAERQARFNNQPGIENGQPRQHGGYQSHNQMPERGDIYGGDQPDLTPASAPIASEGAAEAQPRRFDRNQNRDGADRRADRNQALQPPRARAPLEPLNATDDAAENSGPIFSLGSSSPTADKVDPDIAPDRTGDAAVSEEPKALRRRGRPAKTETTE